MSEVKYNPGDIVELGGIKFVVLDNDYGGVGDLFILALEIQGKAEFGKTNNYLIPHNISKLARGIANWNIDFAAHLSFTQGTRIRFRTLDLTTLDGRGHYGTLRTKCAPLTMDEAREYADVIPPCDKPWWLATGWGGPGYFGSTCALVVSPIGNLSNGLCSYSYGIRPALVIDPAPLDKEETPDQDAPQIPDLSGCSTDDLLAEIKRRMED